MTRFILGAIMGSLLTAGLSLAGTFYNSDGSPNAPTGSIQQFDSFRERGAQLDIQRIARGLEQDRLNNLTRPCGR